MNISGALSIRTAQIGGQANGTYVDSDKFKSSDINFHLQVKVTNQIHDAPEYSEFNLIENVNKNSFPDVYGDTFISGWEEGGELNAIISMEVNDKSKIFAIKAHLEAQLTTPSIAGKVSIDADIDKKNLNKDAKTTITVNWSGGGSIKDPTEDWSIDSLKKAAAAFPELVAVTPQRTYAILTKYTALASFHKKNLTYSPLDYENAGIYTNSLLDSYMDYKSLWKQISQATKELEGNRATIEVAQPTEDIYKMARVKALPPDEINLKKRIGKTAADSTQAPELPAPTGGSQQQVAVGSTTVSAPTHSAQYLSTTGAKVSEDTTVLTVFQPSFAGLVEARKVCRFEMSKLVNEVNLVSKRPDYASDTTRDDYFLHPLIFKQLLPMVRSLSPENARLGIKDPNATLMLGYCPPPHEHLRLPPVYKLVGDITDYHTRLQESAHKLKYKADDYQMEGCVGTIKHIHESATFFNDLEKLDSTYRPTLFSAWTDNERLVGASMQYANGAIKNYGLCQSKPTKTLELAGDGSEAIVEVTVKAGADASDPNKRRIVALSLVTSSYNTLHIGENYQGEIAETKSFRWSKKGNEGKWTIRGFFGFNQNNDMISLGVVWGKDGFVPIPPKHVTMPLCKHYLGLSADLQQKIQTISRTCLSFPEKFLMGKPMITVPGSAPTTQSRLQAFNALEKIDLQWKIQKLGFVSKNCRLAGLKVTYENAQEYFYGPENFKNDTVAWSCEVKTLLTVVKITAGKITNDGDTYIDTVEFIRTEADGELPEWLLDLSTLRYLGEGETRVSTESYSDVVESAPTIGNGTWSIRGFYGEHSDTQLTQLGVIWGRG